MILRVGRSKSDQMGTRSILHPREFPISSDILSAGARIKDLFCNRYNLSGSEIQAPQNPEVPLFLTQQHQPLKERHVLKFIRQSAVSFGYSPENISQIGTRSLRIGGSTALFKAGASADQIRHMGGWSTDTYRANIRSLAPDFHKPSVKMIGQ